MRAILFLIALQAVILFVIFTAVRIGGFSP